MKKRKMPRSKAAIDSYPLISVIVPVYQVEKYLDACIQSLCRQTYKKLEVLLIDDGSTDASPEICDKYAESDSRFHVLHQSNKGLSAARNEGLRMARGEYIAFVDSDDLVSPVYIEVLYRLAVRYHADVSICGYASKMEDLVKNADILSGSCLPPERMLREWHGKRKHLETVVWNKLYYRTVLTKISSPNLFPEGKLYEDVYVSHLLIQNSKKVVLTTDKLYMYRRRNSGIKNGNITEAKIQQNLDAQMVRLRFFMKEGMKESSRHLAVGLFLHMLMFDWKLLQMGKLPVKKKEILNCLWKVVKM